MRRSVTRRGLMASFLVGSTGTGLISPANGILEAIAPLSGDAYRRARTEIPGSVGSPHGSATVTYDDHHVPHIEADNEPAAFFAVGYTQAADRLFQMDLFRRRGQGRLAEVVGPPRLEADIFRTKMDFQGAVAASKEAIAGSEAETMLAAYADGVNAFIADGPLGLGFELLDYEPEPWSVTDSLFIAMAMNEQQTLGAFPALREAVKRDVFDGETYEKLSPTHFDHGSPVLRDGQPSTYRSGFSQGGASPTGFDPAFVEWLSGFGGPDMFGSNAWVVSGEHTATGDPILCNDPHLPLQAPPIFYQQHLSADDLDVRGVAFPGAPFVMAGQNQHGAWGFTSAPVDMLDCYVYEIDGETYRYGDEWREFETEEVTVPVRFGDDRVVEVKKTIHGPLIEREVNGTTHRIGVAWTPLTGTRTVEAIYGWNTAEGLNDFRAATEKLDTPPLHVHYADRAGETLYQLAAKVPIRRIDGHVVRGDRVFDGSEGQAEWDGFEPYGQSTFAGFIPFEDLPAEINPDYVASANQRATDDPAYPLGSEFHPGFRASRIYERLDRAVEASTAIDTEFMRDLQLDTVDERARLLVPAILDAREQMTDRVQTWVDLLEDWDYRMDRGSRAALLFKYFMQYFEEETWRDVFRANDLSRAFWPSQWVLVNLPPDSDFFDGSRASVIATAIERAIDRIEEADWGVYGDANQASIDHPLGPFVSGLNYPQIPVDGSSATVNAWYGFSGVSYRLISALNGESIDVLPGGNDGTVYSDHYYDQLRLWAGGEYTELDASVPADPDIEFRGSE